MSAQRILLVDDDPGINELFAMVLRDEGYVVDVATTAAEAKAAIDGSHYTMLISDWRLPDGDGLQIADRAAADRIETVVITGHVISRGGRAERHEILTKPVRPDQLLAAVKRRIGSPQP